MDYPDPKNRHCHRCFGCFLSCDPIPSPVFCVLAVLFVLGLAVSVFTLVAVHNALLLLFLLVLFALVLSFLWWNSYCAGKDVALRFFLERFPESDTRTARNGQLVKITGFVSCQHLSLESSYEKISRCVYTSTQVYSHNSHSKLCFKCSGRDLTYSERCLVDFCIRDLKSGLRLTVKAGNNSKVIPLIEDTILVRTSVENKILSPTLVKWLGERNLSIEAWPLHLEEGYVAEGSCLTVFGKLNKDGDNLTVLPPGPTSTGCLLGKLLLPTQFDGIIFCHADVSSQRSIKLEKGEFWRTCDPVG